MTRDEREQRLEEAFDRIEETILPCIAMMLDTLLDASANLAETDPKALAAERGTRRIAFTGNVLTDVESEHDEVQESAFTGNLAP